MVKKYRKNGTGKVIVKAFETYSLNNQRYHITINSRENAV